MRQSKKLMPLCNEVDKGRATYNAIDSNICRSPPPRRGGGNEIDNGIYLAHTLT